MLEFESRSGQARALLPSPSVPPPHPPGSLSAPSSLAPFLLLSKINHFIVNSSAALSTFPLLCNHGSCPFQNIPVSQREPGARWQPPRSLRSSSPAPPLPDLGVYGNQVLRSLLCGVGPLSLPWL